MHGTTNLKLDSYWSTGDSETYRMCLDPQNAVYQCKSLLKLV